jgi:hypothetical protein
VYVRPLTAAAIVCAYVCPAFAEPSEADIKKASALFDEAEKKFKIGEYQLALADYKAAYLLTGEPALLFNIGQCHRFLGNDQEAIKSYKVFLRDANPDGSSRAIAEKLIAELEGKSPSEQKATLEAKAPTGAEGAIFFLDGAPLGPLPISTTIAPGKHNVELRKDNLILYSESVEVRSGELRSLSISISKEPIEVNPNDPSKAEGVLLRFNTPLAGRAFDLEVLPASKGRMVCPTPITLTNPCELRVPAKEKIELKIGNCADKGLYCSSVSFTSVMSAPESDSVMFLSTPQAPRLGRTLTFAGVVVGGLGLIVRNTIGRGFEGGPGIPPKPGTGLLVAGGLFIPVGVGMIVVRRLSIKKYYESNPAFVPLTTTP